MTPQPKKILGNRRRGDEELAYRRPNRGFAGSRFAEYQPEPRTGRPKLRRRGHRQVELERLRKQEHPVNSAAALEIGKLDRGQFVDKAARPVGEDRADGDMVGDAEREIQIREAVALIQRKRTDSGARDDAIIVLGEQQHTLAQSIPLLDGEHTYLRAGEPRQL